MELTTKDIIYIESKLGWQLGPYGIKRANQLLNLGATLDEIVEALTLL